MQTEHFVESRAREIKLEEAQVDLLRQLGRTLAADRRWWGDKEDDVAVRSVIRCERVAQGIYSVSVRDAVGVIGVGDLQLVVEPKIPLLHFVYLLGESRQVPRLSHQKAAIKATDDGFFGLIFRWFIATCEVLLRHDLIRDYEPISARLTAVRGRIQPYPTLRSIIAGRPSAFCDFDQFGEDCPLNRVLRAATEGLLSIPDLPLELRRRARRVHARLGAATTLRPSDTRSIPDARSRHYRDAHPLALCILSGIAPTIRHGGLSLSSFLFRTPESIEEGVREVLAERLGARWRVRKKGRLLAGSRARTLNPDLLFGDDEAVGDVKYRLSDGDIERSHLSQVTTFATGYRVTKATVIGFGPLLQGEHVQVGDVRIDGFNWNTNQIDPSIAGNLLADALADWLRVRAMPSE